ncbi:hypothetical protein NEMBOFW57_003523 [Staphylotrichum longicolle]|uniref:Uncharacterized protein n=1 Tax=Staphylotrichum longicolle TaxID=669026 RepID=A0AAD4F5E1_9PEZI|nr:hypothetical protein NEMBOFW57_003523 [Staphylotrichum longicolle]
MAFPSRVLLLLRVGSHKQGLVGGVPSCNLSCLIAAATASTTTTSSPSRSNYYGRPTFSCSNPHDRGFGTSPSLSSSKPTSSQPSTQPSPPSPQPGGGPAPSPTRLFIGKPITDEARDKAEYENMMQRVAEKDPVYEGIMRKAAFDTTVTWLQVNFPEDPHWHPSARATVPTRLDGNGPPRIFRYCHAGPFPTTISYLHDDGTTKMVPPDDTRLVFVGRSGDRAARVGGIKQGGTVCVAITVLPPPGVGEGETAGQPLARTAGTTAMDAANAALLAFIRETQDRGFLGSPPLGPELEGSLAIVFMGADLFVSEYSQERGFFDPPGGFAFEETLVDMGEP